MLAESLVIYGCVIGQCTEVVSAYNVYNPDVYKTVKIVEKKATRIASAHLGSHIVNFAIPTLTWLVRQDASFTLRRNMTMRISYGETSSVAIRYEF